MEFLNKEFNGIRLVAIDQSELIFQIVKVCSVAINKKRPIFYIL